MNKATQERVQVMRLEDIMGDRFGRYSKYIIKIVHYQMCEMD